jgi:putative ABC transport system permease protein
VVSEIALALVLLTGAGLMARSFLNLREVNPGFNPKDVLTVRLWLPRSKYAESSQIAAVYQSVLERVENLPGVKSAGVTFAIPLGGMSAHLSFVIEGRPKPEPGREIDAALRLVSSEYFRTMGILTRWRLDQRIMPMPRQLRS